ncbi:MAG TPA: hypothetical protein PK114_08695 [Smithellaceae bacterium]|nr:hypothetical protein [Smithellaceae bacterium]
MHKIRHRYFSLVELLVIIAVIAVLAGMLLPALNAARSRARSTRCAANLKQVAAALFSYAGDWDRMMLSAASGTTSVPTASYGNLWAWNYALVHNGYLPDPKKQNVGGGIFFCPDSWPFIEPDKQKNLWYSYGAVHNKSFRQVIPLHSRLILKAGASRVTLAGDCWRYKYPPAYPFYRMSNPALDGDEYGFPALAHRGKCNMVFMDGHFVPLDERGFSGNYYNGSANYDTAATLDRIDRVVIQTGPAARKFDFMPAP